MSGAEVIGIISGVIAIIDATAKIYKAANDASGLPEAFRDIATRLPLVCQTLQTVSENLNKTIPDEECCEAIKPVLRRCESRATQLEKIFKDVVPHAHASRMERYTLATRTWAKGDTVELLMKGILEDVQLLASNRVAELPTQASVAAVIREAIEEVSAIPLSLPNGIPPPGRLLETSNTEQAFTDPLLTKANETPYSKRSGGPILPLTSYASKERRGVYTKTRPTGFSPTPVTRRGVTAELSCSGSRAVPERARPCC